MYHFAKKSECFFFWVEDFQNIYHFPKTLLCKQIIDSEQSSLDNTQYLRREMNEGFPVSLEVSNN